MPAYLRIDTFHLTTNLAEEGFASHKITDAWIFVNDISLGTYELPVTLPVLEKGEREVIVRAGIKDNGISSTRAIYPMFRAYETTMDFREGEVDTLLPQTSYFSNVEFVVLERFETGNEFSASPINEAVMETVNDPELIFEGNRSLRVTLTETEPFFEAHTRKYELPGGGKPVYLELDYKTDNPFDVWLRANFDAGANVINTYVVTVTAKESWNKIYVNLSEMVSTLASADNFEIFILANKPNDVAVANMYLDNIKLLHL